MPFFAATVSPGVLGSLLACSLLALAALAARHGRLARQAKILRRRNDLVLASISDRITYLDRDLSVVWTNWPRSGALDTASAVACHRELAGRQTPCPGCPVPQVLASGEPAEGVVSCREERVLRISAAPVRDESGELVGVVQTSRDITEKRRFAERLQEVQKLEAVGQLAAGVAHDFNNSLQVILGHVDLLTETLPAGVDATAQLAAMRRAASQARDVVQHLLTFSRRTEPRPQDHDLAADVCEQAGVLDRVVGSTVRVAVDVPHGLPLAHVDPPQVERVLLNLCMNARDAMPDGGQVVISLRERDLSAEEAAATGAAAAGPYLELAVADDGQGIPEGVRDRIFEPFFTTKGVERGTGLGLATVYGIARAHGGYVEVESAVGRGTTFRVGWPTSAVAAAASAAGVAITCADSR
jgi:signal transduction histidine kinase